MLRIEEEPEAVACSELEISRGAPLPLGATAIRDGINFAVFSRDATSVTLVLFRPHQQKPFREVSFDIRFNRTGHIWHAFIKGLDPGIRYGYRMDREHNSNPRLYRYDPRIVLLDPCAKAISGHTSWASQKDGGYNHRRSIVLDGEFDWGTDQPLNIPLSETVIYEVHLRGFTRDPSSKVAKPGTFAGLIEKIPYLQDLGITAVELLPVHEFEELDSDRVNPFTGERLRNYWGYQPISFFAPNAAYSSRKGDGDQVREFKQLVKSLHQAGIEVILDVVFNHTAEGNDLGPTFSFRGIDNTVYYIVDPHTGAYLNYSGCGNTLNCNHPVVRELIADCLRYWVMEMHVDGFRFDLASILGRGQDGSVLLNPPLLETLAHDPVLANTKLIAEAWDAAGLYQVGTFPAWSRWAEWNGKFRDEVRRFVRAEPGMVSNLATRLVGSPDLYRTSSREPYHSINFVTCHDGFTLADLVSYDSKHNEINGEDNVDGTTDNLSWNCGVEGPTDWVEINALRRRQMKNFATILLLADGVPMILAGDEMARTQLGNNNAYCQDNEIELDELGADETERGPAALLPAADCIPQAASAIAGHQLPVTGRGGSQADRLARIPAGPAGLVEGVEIAGDALVRARQAWPRGSHFLYRQRALGSARIRAAEYGAALASLCRHHAGESRGYYGPRAGTGFAGTCRVSGRSAIERGVSGPEPLEEPPADARCSARFPSGLIERVPKSGRMAKKRLMGRANAPASRAPAQTNRFFTYVPWVLLCCATFFAYWPAVNGGLVWDDNGHVTPLALQSWHGLWRIWFELGATQQYYPLLHTAFWIEHRIWGDAVTGYHLLNIGLHAFSACLVVAIVRRLGLPGGWLAGFLFALHPVCVESVAWISEQKNTLSAVFCLAAALVYVRFDKTGGNRNTCWRPPYSRQLY